MKFTALNHSMTQDQNDKIFKNRVRYLSYWLDLITSFKLTAKPQQSMCVKVTLANVAQMVEQLTRNEQVAGSSPAVGSCFFEYHL